MQCNADMCVILGEQLKNKSEVMLLIVFNISIKLNRIEEKNEATSWPLVGHTPNTAELQSLLLLLVTVQLHHHFTLTALPLFCLNRIKKAFCLHLQWLIKVSAVINMFSSGPRGRAGETGGGANASINLVLFSIFFFSCKQWRQCTAGQMNQLNTKETHLRVQADTCRYRYQLYMHVYGNLVV